jgi:hypothetical protein
MQIFFIAIISGTLAAGIPILNMHLSSIAAALEHRACK